MSDNFFEELDRGFEDIFGPITDPVIRLNVLRSMIMGIENNLENLEGLEAEEGEGFEEFIEAYNSPDPEVTFREDFREQIELMDRISSRLLEGIERPNTTLSPEEIELGNFINSEEPIRDPLVRWAGFEALRAYIRVILELIAEGDFSEQISGPDSADFMEKLWNTFLELGDLVLRLYEGLEADMREETESRPGDSAESLAEHKARINSVKLILDDIGDLDSEIQEGTFPEFISKPEEIIFVDSRLHWLIKRLISWAETIEELAQKAEPESESRKELSSLRALIWRLRDRIAEPKFLGRIHSPEGENLIGEIELFLANIETPLREILSRLEAESHE